jgi:hypothetical protein
MSNDTPWFNSFSVSSHSNYIPSDEEAAQIKAFLTQSRQQPEEMKQQWIVFRLN